MNNFEYYSVCRKTGVCIRVNKPLHFFLVAGTGSLRNYALSTTPFHEEGLDEEEQNLKVSLKGNDFSDVQPAGILRMNNPA